MKKIVFVVLVLCGWWLLATTQTAHANDSRSAQSGGAPVPYKMSLPFVVNGNIQPPMPDIRFGLNNVSEVEAATLGFSAPTNNDRYRLNEYQGSVIRLMPGSISGFRAFVGARPGRAWIVGNEPANSNYMTPTQHAKWYHDTYYLIKSIDPTAKVAYYATTVRLREQPYMLEFWTEYKRLYRSPVPTDFIAFHYYPARGTQWSIDDMAADISRLIAFLDAHRGAEWDGPRLYWLTEFGLRAWEVPVSENDAMAFMSASIAWLKGNPDIAMWAWWPSGRPTEWSENTSLIKDGAPTELGKLYLELAK